MFFVLLSSQNDNFFLLTRVLLNRLVSFGYDLIQLFFASSESQIINDKDGRYGNKVCEEDVQDLLPELSLLR